MELYKVTPGSRIRVLPENENNHPPEHREFTTGEELEFRHIDGMYSFCIDDQGNPVHLKAWAEVEVMREGKG